MSIKKRKRKNALPAISLTEIEQTQMASVLADLKGITSEGILTQITSDAMAMAFVERLPADTVDSLGPLMAIRDTFKGKDVQKAVKKHLYKLRQRGISISEGNGEENTSMPGRKIEEGLEPTVYLGPVDGSGSRGIFIALPKIPWGVDVGMGVVNDEDGFIQFLYGRYSRRRMREIRDIFLSNFFHPVETSISHGTTVLERSYRKNQGVLHEASKGYLQLRPWLLENAPPLDEAAIYDLLPPEGISKDILTRSRIEALLSHELLRTWIVPDMKGLKALIEDMEKIQKSPILISDAQRMDQIAERKRKALTEIFSEERRRILKWRLEETAYVLFRRSEEDMARVALAAAKTLEETSLSVWVHPFLNAMLEHTLALIPVLEKQGIEREGKGGRSAGLIITP